MIAKALEHDATPSVADPPDDYFNADAFRDLAASGAQASNSTFCVCNSSQLVQTNVRKSVLANVGCGSIPTNRVAFPQCAQAGHGSGVLSSENMICM
jgi:hypothetical protein